MTGRSSRDQGQLFYSFNLEEVVLDDHLVRCARAASGHVAAAPPRSVMKPRRPEH